jgi:hypothetical protein
MFSKVSFMERDRLELVDLLELFYHGPFEDSHASVLYHTSGWLQPVFIKPICKHRINRRVVIGGGVFGHEGSGGEGSLTLEKSAFVASPSD